MRIAFKKKTGGRFDLICVRDDGSVSRGKSVPGMGEAAIPHDLVHYAVETVLGLRRGFYGLVAEGWGIDELLTPDGKKEYAGNNDAQLAELLVSMFQSEMGYQPENKAKFHEILAGRCAEAGLIMPIITDARLAQVRESLVSFEARWRAMKTDDVLQVEFPPKAKA